MQKKLLLPLLGIVALAAAALQPEPAHAFWLGVPDSLKSLWQQVMAQEGGMMMPPPGGGMMAPPPGGSSGGMMQPPPGGTGMMPPPGGTPGQMPGGNMMPPPGGQPGMMPGGDMMGRPPSGDMMPFGGDQKMMGQDQMRKDMQNGTFQMDRNLGQFERNMRQDEQNGHQTPQDTQMKMDRARGMVDNMKGFNSPSEMKNVNMNQLGEDMGGLDQERREREMQAQQLKQLQRGLRGMEQGVNMFERQINAFAKRKLPVPAEVAEKVAKAKAIIAAVKSAKTFDDAQAAGLEDMGEIMQELNESRMQLEMVARWPQMLKDVDRQLAQLQREVKRDKAIVDRLLKKDIDLTSSYTAFVDAVGKLKAVRDEAAAKVQAGEAQEAMDMIQNDFYPQLEDTWQYHKIIMTMSNLGRFVSEFKRGLADAQRMIRAVERKKLDASELKDLYAQAKAKGEEIQAMLKGGEVDEELIMSTLSEMEDIHQQFEAKYQELMGIQEQREWEKGPQQFREIQVSSDVSQFFSRPGGGTEGSVGGGGGPQPAGQLP